MNGLSSQTLDLDITDIAFGGDGVGRSEGCAVFVPFVIPGERVRVEVMTVFSRYARAVLREVLIASPDRAQPLCPYFGRCGGCRYQHMTYDRQLQIKRKQVSDAMLRGGRHGNAVVCPPVASSKAYGYRNRIELQGPGRPAFLGLDGRSRVPVEGCLLADEPINRRLAARDLPRLGAHERLLLRSAPDGGCYAIRRKITDGSCRGFPTPTAGVLGEREVFESVGGMTLTSPIASFFQVNREVLERVIEGVQYEVRGSGCEYFLEAHAGVGVFSLALADTMRFCTGVEADASAVSAARQNARVRGVTNCRFEHGLAEKRVPELLASGSASATCLFLDPPRGGCAARFLEAAALARPRQILYLSCSPPMLARDAAVLVRNGYVLRSLTPFDMFPQTAHVETLAVFEPGPATVRA